MSILFSRRCEYALQAILYLARQPEGTTISIRELTDRLGLPFHFMAKILRDLRKEGLLVSAKGPAGGFSLATPAERISLLKIVEAIDGGEILRSCVLGFEQCSNENPCSMHHEWSVLRDRIFNILGSKTLEEMAVLMKKWPYLQNFRV
jgi:Rrf2 family protein